MSAVRAFIAAIFILILGCQTVSNREPTATSKPDSVPIQTQAQWLRDYKWAVANSATESAKACDMLLGLSKEENFPARQLADLRSYAACAQSGTQTKLKPLNRSVYPEWLQNLSLDVALKWVRAYGDKAVEMDLAVEKSKQKLPQSEKIQWIHLASERATELKDAAKLADLKKRLYVIAPRLNPEPQEKEFPSVAQDFRQARQFEKARKYYTLVLNSPNFGFDEKLSSFKGLRLAYKNQRNDKDHIETSKRLVQFANQGLKANPKAREFRLAAYDAQMYLGRALWTLGKTAEAGAVFDKLEKQMKGKLSLAELYWIKGRMREEVRDFDGVSAALEKALAEKPTGELLDKILWYAAWNERKRDNFLASAEKLKELDATTQVDFTRNRALFWQAKALADAKDEKAARVVFEKLIDLDPLGYYGLLAHGQLNKPIALPKNSREQASVPKLPLDSGMAEWLRLLDEKDVLTSLLDQASAQYKKQKDQTDEGWSTLFKYYAKAGLFMKLYENMAIISADRRKAILESHPELLFPQPWSEEVRTASIQFDVDEELILAIMRQESAFDAMARSHADAFGLMQVLPELAEKLGHRFKIPYKEMDDLYQPRTNISVGTAHLKELLHRHKGRLIPAVASYNASESAINGWVKSRFKGDALEFIEEIPYEETRGYVRLVLRNMTFYYLLRSKTPTIEFPSRLWQMSY